jgi:predicted HTH transcriptional regulator
MLTLMLQNPAITYKELAASINKSTSTVKRYIQELKASGTISRIGGTKGGRWEVM